MELQIFYSTPIVLDLRSDSNNDEGLYCMRNQIYLLITSGVALFFR